MSDAQKGKALKEDEIDSIPTPSPSVEEEETGEVEETLADSELTGEEEAREEPTETEESSKKGFSSRVRELNAKKKEAEARAEQAEEQAKSLAEKLGELTGSVEPGGGIVQPQYSPKVEPGAEISPEDYRRDVTLTAQGLVQLELKKQQAINKIDKEAGEVIKLYPQLDPDSDDFDRELSDSVTEAVEAHVRANPYNSSVKAFTAKLMKPYLKAVQNEVGKVTENVAKQASGTAARPTSVKGGEKKFEELSEEEMEEKLGVVY